MSCFTILKSMSLALVVGAISVGSPVLALDQDGNGIDDVHEQELAEMFCPSLVLDSRDKAEDISVCPEPVEIVSDKMYGLIRSFADESFGGHRHYPYDEEHFPGGDYSFLLPMMYSELQVGSCRGFDRVYIWFHFDFAGFGPGCTDPVSNGFNDQPEGWRQAYQQKGPNFPHTVYAHLFRHYYVPSTGYAEYAIQYWYFYPYNDWVNDHEGDWEHIDVHFTGNTPASANIKRVVYYFHHQYKICEHVQGEDPPGSFQCYVMDDTHPVVFVGGWGQKMLPGGTGSGPGSHGCYPVFGTWDKVVDEEKLGVEYFSINESINGSGAYIPWFLFVDDDSSDRYGVVVIKNPDQYDFSDSTDVHMSWIKADIQFGHPQVHSLGSQYFIPLAFGNDAPRGPYYQPTWENSGHDAGVFRQYLGSANEYPLASDAQWEPPAPLIITAPVDNDVVSDIVSIRGSLLYADSMTVETGVGTEPSTWSKVGMETAQTLPIFESSIGTWNTGTVPAGTYSIRVKAHHNGQQFEEVRTVTVTHRSAVVAPTGDFTHIQNAINWAKMGDTLKVYGNQYDENVIMKQTVHLLAMDSNTEIVGLGDSPVITISDHDFPCYINGFKITHENTQGFTDGHGVKIVNSNPVLSNCVISDNEATMGAGVKVEGDSRPVFDNCEFSGNVGGGVAVIGDATDKPVAEFYNCRFDGNVGPKGAAVTIEYDSQNPLNGSPDYPKFVDCIFDGNLSDPTPYWYGTVGLQYCYDVLFDHCTFTNNDPATSGYVAGVIYGNFEGTITNCTIADNKENSGVAYFAGVERSYVGQPGPLEITNTIIAFNNGPAVTGNLDYVSVIQSNFYGNLYWDSFPTDADWATVPLGLEMISEDPAFCNAQNGDYHIYAFSPCAPNVSFYDQDLMGSYEIGCIPPTTVSVVIDSLLITDLDTLMVACPQGDEDYEYIVAVDFEDSVITRTIEPDEITIQFSSPDAILVFDEDGVIDADISAESSNGYQTTITHKWFGGYGNGNVSVFLNGTLLDTTGLDLRTYDWTGDGGPPDGIVELAELSTFGTVYQSPPNPYVPHMDFNADGLIDLADFSLLGEHWTHASPYQQVQGEAPIAPQQTDCAVALTFTDEAIDSGKRELRVDITLQNISVFKAMCVSLRNENEALKYREWKRNDSYPNTVMVAPITRDGVSQVFMGIMGSKSVLGPTQNLGTLVFDVIGTQELELAESDFELVVGSVLLASGSSGLLRGVSKEPQEGTRRIYHNYLSQNYPNPFNPLTTIEYSIKDAAHVELKVFNVSGQLVRVLENGDKTPNVFQVNWDGTDDEGNRVASGVYFYRLQAGDYTETKKMVLLK